MPIFISYSHKNKDFVDSLAEQLVKNGIHVWIDRWELNIGDSLFDKVQAAIKGSSALLVILSTASVMSDWVNKEINAGLILELEKHNTFVLPVLFEDCDVPLFLRDKLYADFRNNFDEGLKTIIEGVAKVTNPDLSRHNDDEEKYYVDWGIDWRYLGDNFHLNLTFVEQAKNSPYTVLTTLDIHCSKEATKMYQEKHDSNDKDEAVTEILRKISSDFEGVFQIILTDHFEKTFAKDIFNKLTNEGYYTVIRSRRLGSDTGKNIIVNVATLLEGAIKHREDVTKKI